MLCFEMLSSFSWCSRMVSDGCFRLTEESTR